MCDICDKLFSENLGKKLQTATSKPFTFSRIDYDKIFIINDDGNERSFHRNHVSDCVHWLVKGNTIFQVSGPKSSIRNLIGSEGTLAKCDLCERNPVYIWGILAKIPNILRSGSSLKLKK